MQAPRISCYISSGVGAVIVGLLSLIGSLICVIMAGISFDHSYSTSPYREMNFTYWLHEMYVIVLLLANAISSSFMMHGAIKGKHAFMFPWLGTFITATAMTICFGVAVVLSYLVSWNLYRDLSDFSTVLGITLMIATVGILFCAVVYNHYKQIVSRNSTQSIHPYTLSDTIIKSPISYQKV